MITVHHLNNSRSMRIIWLLEELGVEYHIKYYQRDPKTLRAPEALKAIHPLGVAPIITDGEITLAESGAIVEYILFRYAQGSLKPAMGTPEWTQYQYWLHFAEGSLMPLLFLKFVFDNVLFHLPFFVKPIFKTIKNKVNQYLITPRLTLQLNYIESTLEKTLWFAGNDFTAADIQMTVPLLWAVSGNVMPTPKIKAFLARVKERSAYIQTLAKGGDISRVTLK